MASEIVIIDNFDSFVYNIFQYIGELGFDSDVVRNTVPFEKIEKYEKIIISPGPGNPENEKDFGICKQAILELGKTKPILGICLGHQGIAHAFGGKIVKVTPMHGKKSRIFHNGKGIFKNVKNPLNVMRYHSLAVDESTLPSCLQITARTKDNMIMGLSHKKFPIVGIQFHPESIFTEEGKKVLLNFLLYEKKHVDEAQASVANKGKIHTK